MQVLEKLKKPQAALEQYNLACELAPNSSVTRFKKARMLIQMQRPREALEEFKILKDMVPDEPNVHFMLGRVYKTLHDKKSAVKHFTSAMTLDPKVILVTRVGILAELTHFRLRSTSKSTWKTWTTTMVMIWKMTMTTRCLNDRALSSSFF